MKSRFSQYLGLILLTGVATFIALTAGLGRFFGVLSAPTAHDASTADVRVPVEIVDAKPEAIEVLRQYSGMIRPRERYALSFQIPGQIAELGVDAEGQPLDEGDAVKAGQFVARLDDRILSAQCKEAKARLEKAQYDYNLANELRARNRNALSDAEFQDRITQVALTEAAVEMAEKRLTDARITAPVDGVISKRYYKAGEAINLHEPVFDMIEVDTVLLTLGVPESEIREIRVGQKVHVNLLARDMFGQQPASIEGEVYRVDEAADDKTGLFEVEVELPNPQGALKPGLVATGRIVVDVVEGFRLPKVAVVFRDGRTSLFSVDAKNAARQSFPQRWIEQENSVVVPVDQLAEESRRVIVRGQHRLIEGRAVQIAPEAGAVPVENPPAGRAPRGAAEASI